MIYRTFIKGLRDFPKQFVGGRKVARAASAAEVSYLLRLNNEMVKLNQELVRITDELAELRERESNLTYFIAKRFGLFD
jgi:hypothetical protein